jgi:hypothetical protein
MTDTPSDTPKQPKRPPPTIDLEATRPGAGAQWSRLVGAWPSHSLLAALGGAFAALAIVALVWIAGLLPQRSTPIATTNPAIEDIMAQLARTEARIAALPKVAIDPALAARLTSVEQAVQASQSAQQSGAQTLQALRRQLEAMMASLDEIKSTPRAAAPAVDFAPLNQRIGELEQSIRALAQDTAQRKEPAALDAAVGRMLVAQQLDAATRAGTPFVPQLNAAKASGDAAMLAVLEPFAATGLPDDATLARELVALLPQLEPKPVEQAASTGLIDRLEASAARLVRIKPVGESAANDTGGVVSRIATAARRNDVTAARRELDRLDVSQRAPAEAWIKRIDARDAARKATSDFVVQSLAALPKP